MKSNKKKKKKNRIHLAYKFHTNILYNQYRTPESGRIKHKLDTINIYYLYLYKKNDIQYHINQKDINCLFLNGTSLYFYIQ